MAENISNKSIVKQLKSYATVLELHSLDPTKIKAIANSTFSMERLNVPLQDKSTEEIAAIKGIDRSLADDIFELANSGKIAIQEDLIKKTPEGVRSMIGLKGIGAKKIQVIWKDLKIETLEGLKIACQNKEISKLKGFGAKTEENIIAQIEFLEANKGWLRMNEGASLAQHLLGLLKEHFPLSEITGKVRQFHETVNEVALIIGTKDKSALNKRLNAIKEIKIDEEKSNPFLIRAIELTTMTPLAFHISSPELFYNNWLKTSASKRHLLGYKNEELCLQEVLLKAPIASENEAYAILEKPYVEPEMREGKFELKFDKDNTAPNLLALEDLKGPLHNHSTYSDGVNTLEEMAQWCIDKNYEYLGISDHSQSAFFYANGLFEERVLEQHKEIDLLNEKLGPFKIFKGIESDILADGSLDYSKDVLERFDFIVASVHSGMNMDVKTATDRLIKAIYNPYTTFLGHPTGRLLLRREGYPIDHKAVIEACADAKVIIEINANPWRLDIDWRWIPYALEKGVLLSINPDAHELKGFLDMEFGVKVGRKGGLDAKNTFNTWSLEQVDSHFQSKRP